MMTAKLYGIGRSQVRDDDQYEGGTTAATGSNPSKLWYWIVSAYSPGPTPVNVDNWCTIDITYYTMLHQRRNLLELGGELP